MQEWREVNNSGRRKIIQGNAGQARWKNRDLSKMQTKESKWKEEIKEGRDVNEEEGEKSV